MASIMSSFYHVTAKNDGVYCLVREHWLSAAFHTASWDTLSVFFTRADSDTDPPTSGSAFFSWVGVVKGFFFSMESIGV